MIELDKEGFLTDLDAWTPDVAHSLAEAEEIELDVNHWEVIHILRAFYEATEIAPSMRPFVKLVRSELGADKARSVYLMTLFGGSPAKTAAKIAGLPRPTNCL